MIGGNTEAALRYKTAGEIDDSGLRQNSEGQAITILGWLDFLTGGATQMASKFLEKSSHVFIADYVNLPPDDPVGATMTIAGSVYTVVYIDDPMGLHKQLEFYLSVGGLHE